MGLDMEIRRISKPHMDDSVIYNHEDIRGIILTEDNLKEPMYRQLAPYVQPLKVRIQYCDMGKIRKDYGLTDYSYIGMMSAYCTEITDEGTHKSVEISTEDIDKKYTIERVESALCAIPKKSAAGVRRMTSRIGFIRISTVR